MAARKEIDFEDEVVDALLTRSGWTQGAPQDLDLATGINSADLVAFIGATQAEEWDKWSSQFADPDAAQKAFRTRVAQELDRVGTIKVLRDGVKGNGCRFILLAPKPSSNRSQILVDQYDANRLAVTRQQRYNAAHNNTIDVVLWVNGLAIATVELKNPLTGQTFRNAIAQYQKDRDAKDPFLSKRAVVHFAVDPHQAFMTTRLDGTDTRFLPFNRGHDGHQGNPPATIGDDGTTRHSTAYLWDEVWERDAFLELVEKFIHVEVDEHGKQTGTVVFPRFHQWDCVRKLEAHARENGAGHRYLIQHSAGSGKSNSIAWLAHRLSHLHDEHDKAVFDKVIVITDRRVLDEQLSGTVQQFESTPGVVRRIDTQGGAKNRGLAEALTTETARIILCTLQTFSFVDKTLGVGQRNYAVVVDEAHSSQTGEAAADLRDVLGTASEEERLAIAEKAEAGETITGDDLVEQAVAKRGTQKNLSFFAFTATPKARTVEMFGTLDPGTETKRPFHVYSMRQAIEEKFILDVLRNYTTFSVYWKVKHAGKDDPEVPTSKAALKIAQEVSLHPHNVSQRAKIIVDHFRAHVAHHLDGTAKAMVVTASRLHAVRYKQAIDQYLHHAKVTDTRAIVAFSGSVADPVDPDNPVTETSMNGFPESQTGDRFKGENGFPLDDYQLLIVAEKYQTGFDAPRLLAMYVDKKLEGVNAVQTLARLNRSFPGKTQPFVLDFRNDADTITEAFRPWYDSTIVEPADANRLYAMQGELEMFGVFSEQDVDHYWEVFAPIAADARKNNSALYAALAGPRANYVEHLDTEAKREFRSGLDRYARAYAFLSQIVDWNDAGLEKLYVFARSLLADLPPDDEDGSIQVSVDVELTHLRIESRGMVDAGIDDDEPPPPIRPFDPKAPGPGVTPEMARLSEIVQRLNEKFGYQLTVTDALLFEQFKGDWLSDEEIADAAHDNTYENFMILFTKKFERVVLGRMDTNADIFAAIANDKAFAEALRSTYGRQLYEELRCAD